MTSMTEVTNDLYAGFSAEVRQELANHAQMVTASQGTKLLQCGVSPDQLIILNSGSVETSVLSGGKTLSLGVASAGKVFGLHSILDGIPPVTDVTCLEPCEITVVSKRAFLDILQRYPQMYVAVVKVLCYDLAAADRVIRNYARCSRAQLRSVKMK